MGHGPLPRTKVVWSQEWPAGFQKVWGALTHNICCPTAHLASPSRRRGRARLKFRYPPFCSLSFRFPINTNHPNRDFNGFRSLRPFPAFPPSPNPQHPPPLPPKQGEKILAPSPNPQTPHHQKKGDKTNRGPAAAAAGVHRSHIGHLRFFGAFRPPSAAGAGGTVATAGGRQERQGGLPEPHAAQAADRQRQDLPGKHQAPACEGQHPKQLLEVAGEVEPDSKKDKRLGVVVLLCLLLVSVLCVFQVSTPVEPAKTSKRAKPKKSLRGVACLQSLAPPNTRNLQKNALAHPLSNNHT